MSDLDQLLDAAKKDPSDTLTIQALADALEEIGANAQPIRELTIDGPTVLVLGIPENSSLERVRRATEAVANVAAFLQDATGYPMKALVTGQSDTIRVIRVKIAKEEGQSG